MKTKQTPGPWFTLDTGLDVYSEYPAEPYCLPRRRHIAAAITTCQFDQEARANASLIAAAPELLAALEFAIAALTQPVQFTKIRNGASCDILRIDATAVVKQARAAIAKVEGGSL